MICRTGSQVPFLCLTQTTTMIVKFTPSGGANVMDTGYATPSVGPSTAARTWNKLDTQPTDIAYIGKHVSGTLLSITGLDAQAYIVWRTINDNRILQQWKMDDLTAAEAGVDNILAAINDATPVLAGSLDSDGTFTPA